jgi:hypothetical protein
MHKELRKGNHSESDHLLKIKNKEANIVLFACHLERTVRL